METITESAAPSLAPIPKGTLVPEATPTFDKKIYTPGAGYVHNLAAFPLSEIGDMNLLQLAGLHGNTQHPLMQQVHGLCSQGCGTAVHGYRLFVEAGKVACDVCIAKAAREEAWKRARIYWESICPPFLRETDKDHAGFPRAIYESLKPYAGTESLFLFGPTSKGKTRVGMLLLKRCLTRFNLHVAVLWPEQLKAVKTAFNRLELIEKWGRYDLLLMDDALLTGAQDERITDFLKDLLDYRMRYKRHQIITSQIGGKEYEEQAGKFENVTSADRKRVDALLRRVREVCRVVSFSEAAGVGEDQF